MFDLFDVPWRDLKRSDVEAFLDEAGEEGVTWEAKGKGRERKTVLGQNPPQGGVWPR